MSWQITGSALVCVRCGSDKDARLAHQACRPSRSHAAGTWPVPSLPMVTCISLLTVSRSTSTSLAPYMPNVYPTQRNASAIKSHIQLTEHAHHAGPHRVAANNATCDCLVLERPAPVPPYYHESRLFGSQHECHAAYTLQPSLTNQAGGSNLGDTRAKRG